MKPVIFISHSAKDSEVGPIDVEDAAAAERRRCLDYTRLVRSKVVSALTGVKDETGEQRFKVWLDQETLAGGDDWTAKLHRALGTCDAAVILLDPVSAESDWVRKEATILTWRQSLAADVLVVPAYLGEFPRELVEQGPWRPVGIRRLQGVSLPGDPMTEASATKLAELITERLLRVARHDAETPMGQWVADVGALIEEVRLPSRRRAARMLGITDGEWEAVADPHVTMAHHLLHSSLAAAYPSMLELLGGLNAGAGRQLVSRVVPIWVSAEAARHLLTVVVADNAQLILMNLHHQDSARDYLERAWCGRVDRSEVVGVPRASGEGVPEVLADVELALRTASGYTAEDDRVLFEAYLKDASHMFVLIGPNAAHAPVTDALNSQYPGVHFVVLPGHDWGAARSKLAGATLIEPPANPQDEIEARVKSNRLTQNIAR